MNNQWAQHYLNKHFDGKMPKNKEVQHIVEVLNLIDTGIVVELPTGTRAFVMTKDHMNIPNGFIDVDHAASEIDFWAFRGWNVYMQ